MVNHGIILAGGMGTRMRPLTNYIPKGLVEFEGKPIILNSIELYKKFNVPNITLTYNYLSDVLFKELSDKVQTFVNTVGKDNANFLSGSFIKYLNEPIFVLPCDIIMDVNLTEIYMDYLKLGSPAIMIVGVNTREGIAADNIKFNPKNNIIESLTREDGYDVCASGLQVINPSKVISLVGELENFNDVWGGLFNTKELKISNIRPNNWNAYDRLKQILKWN